MREEMSLNIQLSQPRIPTMRSILPVMSAMTMIPMQQAMDKILRNSSVVFICLIFLTIIFNKGTTVL
jgi:hypothetical protein